MGKEFKVNDRVKREDCSGCCGVITDIREEITPVRIAQADKPLLCKVRWDDGIHSYYDLNLLVKVQD